MMLLQSPNHLHYPVTVTELLKRPNEDVDRFAPLFSYTYNSTVTEGNKYGEEFKVEKSYAARFESDTAGTIVRWKIAVGTVIDKAGVDLLEINEPCKHETQFGGLCAICGRDMTEVDYGTTRPDSERANINMAHSNTALRVSQEEAARVEQDAKKRLLESKKLSLVVDLDQTIIHATVDPTVAEWMKDPSNPNYDAVKDVEAFQLLDDGPGRGCWYYIKLRPGLKSFLENISQIYECHIYTMGTRAYAMNIAKIVDPDRRIFGDRILSRDESGSLTAKSLQRLFPTDTKMVVVIDDRGDVWSWSKNLIKVRPYDFFVGIGDINSSFLPKPEQLAVDEQKLLQVASKAEADSAIGLVSSQGTDISPSSDTVVANGSSDHATNGEPSTLDKLVSMGGSNDAAAVKERSDQQDEELAAQLADRPLLQKQKMLDDKAEEEAIEQAKVEAPNGEVVDDAKGIQGHRHNLLQDDDTELYYLETALREVHKRFYDAYKAGIPGPIGGRVAELRQEKPMKKRADEDLSLVPHVQNILPEMKNSVLGNVSLVFSGVVPLGLDARLSDIGQWAQSYGAKVTLDLVPNTTHVIASRTRRTAKVRAAARTTKIKIVTTAWLLDCLSQWRVLEEKPYAIEVEPDFKERPSSQATNSSMWEELNEVLSSSESDGEGEHDEGGDGGAAGITRTAKPSLGLQINADTASGASNGKRDTKQGQGAGDAADDEDVSPASPVDDFGEEDWAEMREEFDDIDDDEEEEEDESDAWQSDGTERTDSTPMDAVKGAAAQKRKRDAATEDGEESEAMEVGEGLGSDLQKRKRRALDRTSSLSNVTTLAMESHRDVGAASGEAPPRGGEQKDGDAEGDETDDGFDAAFEAELEAQLDAEDEWGAEVDDDGG